MRWIILIAGLCCLFMAASALTIYSYGRFARRAKGEPSTALPVADGETATDRDIAPLLADREEQSGLVLLSDNLDAFAARALAARSAGRSLDVMYYFWKPDLTGRLLAQELIAAADRGVRIRLLLDDINTRGRDAGYLALDSHPNISVRLFNPSRARGAGWRRGLEMALRAFAVTRRMHHKLWITDGRLAILGGRNIGDEYFSAAREANFHDLDVLLIGAGVREAEAVFDAYWNSDVVIPIGALVRLRRPRLGKLRGRLSKLAAGSLASPCVERVRKLGGLPAMIEALGGMHWSRRTSIVSDPPDKAFGGEEERWLMRTLVPIMLASEHSLKITSPYFIPGETGTEQLCAMVERGVEVTVLTNSLAATDVAAVHGAYARYRERLLRGGIRIHELQRNARAKRISAFGSSGASLHTKAFTVDGGIGFIGSLNFDPRSASLNTEMGVLFEEADIVREMDELFALDLEPEVSYRLTLEHGRLRWSGDQAGRLRQFAREPDAGLSRRLLAVVIGLLPIESQL